MSGPFTSHAVFHVMFRKVHELGFSVKYNCAHSRPVDVTQSSGTILQKKQHLYA